MTRKVRDQGDPIEREIELALHPGAFISDWAGFAFVSELEEVASQIAQLVTSDPSRAVTLYEIFLAGCTLKNEELDDSSGCFCQFIQDLFCGWLKARQSQDADPDETAARLLEWMDADDYGCCYHLEQNLVKVFDKVHLAAFLKRIRARFDAAATLPPNPDGPLQDRPGFVRRYFGEILRTLYAAQNDIAAYVALAEETGLGAQDCQTIATLLAGEGQPAEALAWVERGIDLGQKEPPCAAPIFHLTRLRRELLTQLGRSSEALASAWASYREHPSQYTYNDLMQYVPQANRAEWHEKALAEAQRADLGSAIDLFVATQEMERLAGLIQQARDQALEDLSHYTTEPLAKMFEKSRPDLAARLWQAQGFRIVNAKKSKYYAAALSNFENAKRCFDRAGLPGEWQKTVDQVRADHRRKRGFMEGFERVVAGRGPIEKPSFLEEAKARFRARGRSER